MIGNDIIAITTKKDERGSVLGTATVSLKYGMSITVNVINGKKGLFVGMPSRKVGDSWEQLINFDDKSDFFSFSDAVKKAWATQQSDQIEEDSFVIGGDIPAEDDVF